MKHDNQAAYSNKDIIEPTNGKPHIVLLRGYWRVSPMPKNSNGEQRLLYPKAHSFVNRLNIERMNRKK